ncbi:efflux RND transporter periplasmic adaptor subunit [Alteromonas sp. BMJM2]|uniref:efflux RND transporter periplasmic adaptor subunit n=1 Tax=Alteromonas sp. BMJM2 TaxID=2954241 RepID=UPI0022B415EA|nr:efflux RND transporter periplasmic adaptor subunit [Alteromonas sp. BMJM2]
MTLKNKLITATISLLIVAMAYSANTSRSGHTEVTSVVQPQLRFISEEVEFSGKLVSKNESHITAPRTGLIESINVVESQHVEAGDILGIIEDDDLQFELQKMTAKLEILKLRRQKSLLEIEHSKKRHAQNLKLYSTKVISEDKLDQQLLNLERQIIDKRQLEFEIEELKVAKHQIIHNIDKSIIRSPISGIVTKVKVSSGESVLPSSSNMPGSVLFVINGKLSLMVVGELAEIDLFKVYPGQNALISFPAFTGIELEGKIVKLLPPEQVSEVMDLSSQFPVHVQLKNTSQRLINGMTAHVRINTSGEGERITLPISSVQPNGIDDYLVVVQEKDGTLRTQKVKVGAVGHDYLEITEGLNGSENIVLNPYQQVDHTYLHRGLDDV